MGVIIRQSIKNALITYMSIVLGALNILYIYPLSFSKDQLGIYQFVLNNALTFYPFVMLGVNALVIRFFPDFRDDKKGHNGFLTLLLTMGVSGFFIFCILSALFGHYVLGFYAEKSDLFTAYLPYFLPLLLLAGLEYILATFCANFSRIAIPALFTNFLIKLSTGILALLVYWGKIDFSQFFTGVIFVHVGAVAGLLFYLYLLGQLHWSFRWPVLTAPLRKAMITYAFFGILGSLSSMLAVKLDLFMVGTLMGLTFTAVFSIAMFIADVLDVPRRAIEGISAPIVAQAWKENNLQEIKNIYQKSSLNQFLAGWFMLIGIWTCIDHLFAIMPNGAQYAEGKYVVLILGIGRLIDLVTGVNHIIISYSKYYKFNFYVILTLGVLNIIGNLIFIPLFGINGAAMSTAFSLGIYNILKLGFIYKKFNLQPFTSNLPGVILLGIIAWGIAEIIPLTANVWLNILIKAALITGIFAAGIFKFNLSPEVSLLAQKGWDSVRQYRRKS